MTEASAAVGIIMGSQSDWETMRHAAETLEAPRRSVRDAHRLRPPHAQEARRVRRGSARPWAQGDRRGRGRRGAPARHDRLDDAAAGHRRPGREQEPEGHGQPALHRPDADGRSGRHGCHRARRRSQRSPARRRDRGPWRRQGGRPRSIAGGPNRPPQWPKRRSPDPVIAPGATIGILGGGQLGRMLALAAVPLGYRCHIFSPEPGGPAAQVSAAETVAAYDDDAALDAFGAAVDVVTTEFENVPASALERLSERVPVRARRPLAPRRPEPHRREGFRARPWPRDDTLRRNRGGRRQRERRCAHRPASRAQDPDPRL